PTRDTLGPMARTVRDAAILLDALAGYDPNDPVTATSEGRMPSTYTSLLTADGLRGKRLGVLSEPIAAGIDMDDPDTREIHAAFDGAVADMAAHGAEIVASVPIGDILPILRGINSSGETEA